jgi:hypothetical protein
MPQIINMLALCASVAALQLGPTVLPQLSRDVVMTAAEGAREALPCNR